MRGQAGTGPRRFSSSAPHPRKRTAGSGTLRTPAAAERSLPLHHATADQGEERPIKESTTKGRGGARSYTTTTLPRQRTHASRTRSRSTSGSSARLSGGNREKGTWPRKGEGPTGTACSSGASPTAATAPTRPARSGPSARPDPLPQTLASFVLLVHS